MSRAAGRSLITFAIVFLAVAVFFGLSGVASAQDAAAPKLPTPSAWPPVLTERLWDDPGSTAGPVQDEPGAPRMLLIYPKPGTKVDWDEKNTRYAGRVEPADSVVRIGDTEITVYPGGVFTGLIELPVGIREVRFITERAGKRTTLARTITRHERRLGPAISPLAFHPAPVEPAGKQEYWLRPDSQFKVRLRASPGGEASFRIGWASHWQPMKEVRATPEEGGAYEAIIGAPESLAPGELTAVEFRVEAGNGARDAEPIHMTSKLRVLRLAADEPLRGEVTEYRSTFLKNPEGWERYGNWVGGVPFALMARLGDRVHVDFGRGAAGYLEIANVRIGLESARVSLPMLAEPVVAFGNADGARPDRVVIDWPASSPVATIFDVNETGDPGAEISALRVSLPGAAGAASGRFAPSAPSPFRDVEIVDGSAESPPEVRIGLKNRELWGYEIGMVDSETLRLEVRSRPAISSDLKRPLKGMRIMLDAGHGGSDNGALGPSGLTEADVNLVLAAQLESRLAALGAEILQARTTDAKVELDARVKEALEWAPDMFISVHHNSVALATHPMKDQGPKVYYHYPHSIGLAGAIAGELSALLTPGKKPRVLKSVFRVNRNISLCPSVLIEGGFICNPLDEIILRDPARLDQMAEAIARGVVQSLSGP